MFKKINPKKTLEELCLELGLHFDRTKEYDGINITDGNKTIKYDISDIDLFDEYYLFDINDNCNNKENLRINNEIFNLRIDNKLIRYCVAYSHYLSYEEPDILKKDKTIDYLINNNEINTGVNVA